LLWIHSFCRPQDRWISSPQLEHREKTKSQPRRSRVTGSFFTALRRLDRPFLPTMEMSSAVGISRLSVHHRNWSAGHTFSGPPDLPMNSQMNDPPGRHASQEIREGRLRDLRRHLARVPQVPRTTRGCSPGELAERATTHAVTGWGRRREGWRLINGVYIAGHGRIDHVLIGPGGVFVIASKWTSNTCRIEFGEIVGLLGRVPVAQAGDGAAKVEKLLRRGPQRFDVEVRPVLVIWGPGGVMLDRGSTDIDGVMICEGRRHRDWVRQLEGPTHLDLSSVDAITRALEDLLARPADGATVDPARMADGGLRLERTR
jgi:Nuclease-related domain